MMRAIVQDAYGSPDRLRLRDVERPQPGDDGMVVRVVAAGVDRGLWHLMTGTPYAVRLMGAGVRAPKVAVPGSNIAGRVECIGANVRGHRVGDAVYGTARGAFAEFVHASPDTLAPKPTRLDFEQAAVIPHGGFAALQALRDHGRVRAGQRVLVVGASGAVGSMAVQIAKGFGAEVTGTCSTTKMAMVHALGADRVLDYSRDDITAAGPRYDLIVDTGGNTQLARLRRALVRNGTLVIVGGEGGGRWLGLGRQIRAQLLSPFVPQRLGTFLAKESASDLRVLTELVDERKLTSIIDRSYPLDEAADAVRYLETGRARGRIAIVISDDTVS